MATREDMRRELKELTKLAEEMRKDAPESRSPYAYLLEPENNIAPHTPDRPLSVSSVTVPPVVAPSVAPPPPVDADDLRPARRGRKGVMALVVGVTLGVALVGGTFAGRSMLTHRAPASAAITVSTGPVQGAIVADPPPPDPTPAPQPVAAPTPPAAEPTPATPPAPAPATALATPAARHKAVAAPARRAPKAAAVAKAAAADAPAAEEKEAPAPAPAKAAPAPKVAAASVAAPAPPAGGSNDSLEDMIRKAVAQKK